MLNETFLEATDRGGRALLAAVRSDPRADIAACPGWDTTKLLAHVGGIHRFVTRIVVSRATEPPKGESTDRPPSDTEPWDWYEQGLAALIKALSNVEPTTKLWTWSDRRDAGFYIRRLAHETSVHRFDAEAAVGGAAHIDSQLATDGVNEIMAVGMRYRANGASLEYPNSSMLMVRSDGAERWLVRAVDGTLLIAHNGDAGSRADVTVTGPAEDLFLHLWGRRAPTLTISGDADAAAAWGAVAP